MKLTPYLGMTTFVLAASAAMAADDGPETKTHPTKSRLSGPTITVPLNMDTPRPMIEVSINGKGPFPFVFDTGAEGMVIMEDLAKELGLPVVGTSHIGDPINPKAIEIDRVSIDTLSIGGATFSELEANSWDAPPGFGMHAGKLRGIIGLAVMSEYLVTLDLAGGRLILSEGVLPEADEREIIDYTSRYGGIPSVRIQVGDVSLSAHIDTGSPAAITIPEKLKDRLKFESEPVVTGHARTVNNSFDVLKATLDGNARIGGHVFEHPDLGLISLLNDLDYGNIGSALLRDFAITFDQKNTRVRFAKRTKGSAATGIGHGHVAE